MTSKKTIKKTISSIAPVAPIVHKTKLAVFDVDWTLIKPLSNSNFPKDVDDWQWWRQSVPETLNMYFEHGYTVILWTNQSKSWKVDMINEMICKLNFKPELVICTNKANHKPDVEYFWEIINTENITENFDMDESFMCGDALGRPGDHSSCDFDGAVLLNIDCYAPEDIFPEDPSDILALEPTKHKEIIIMCGYPGSGKTTFANSIKGYRTLSLDDTKSIPKMLKAAAIQIEHTSVIFDATNMTAAKRKVYVDFAQEYELPVRCVWIDMTSQKAIDRNIIRGKGGGKKVPNIAIYKLRKTYEYPSEIEGFEIVKFTIR